MEVSWPSRTESAAGKTSPEELIAAAHAACFNMALSAGLGRAGFTPTSLETTATASFEKVEAGWRLVRMALKVIGDVPDMEDPAFVTAATACQGRLPGVECAQRQCRDHRGVEPGLASQITSNPLASR